MLQEENENKKRIRKHYYNTQLVQLCDIKDKKIDKLEKENEDMKVEYGKLQEILKTINGGNIALKEINNHLEKQLAITDKALDKACERLIQKSEYYKGCKIEEVKEDILHDID